MSGASLVRPIVHLNFTEIMRNYIYSLLILTALLLGMTWQHDDWVRAQEAQKTRLHSWQEQRIEEAFIRELKKERDLIEYRNAAKF